MTLRATTWYQRLRDRRYTVPAMKALLWWLGGLWVALSYDYNRTLGVAGFLGIGALLGGILGALFWAVNKYRTERGLTWAGLAWRAFLFALAWGIVAGLARMSRDDWSRVTPVLVVIGFYAAYVAAGLVVLYLAVRVVRIAWMGPVTALADALNKELAERDKKIDQLRKEVEDLRARV